MVLVRTNEILFYIFSQHKTAPARTLESKMERNRTEWRMERRASERTSTYNFYTHTHTHSSAIEPLFSALSSFGRDRAPFLLVATFIFLYMTGVKNPQRTNNRYISLLLHANLNIHNFFLIYIRKNIASRYLGLWNERGGCSNAYTIDIESLCLTMYACTSVQCTHSYPRTLCVHVLDELSMEKWKFLILKRRKSKTITKRKKGGGVNMNRKRKKRKESESIAIASLEAIRNANQPKWKNNIGAPHKWLTQSKVFHDNDVDDLKLCE